MKSVVLRSAIAISLVTLASCATPTEAPPDAPPAAEVADPTPVADDAVFEETSVWVDAGGSMRVTVRQVTAGEQRAAGAARERAAHGGPAPLIARDTACGNDSFWLFDRQDWTGNEICFAGAGVQTLHLLGLIRTVCRPHLGCIQATWMLSSGSFWAGASPGAVWTGPSPGTPIDGGVDYPINFGAWQRSPFDVGASYVDHVDLAQ